MDDTAIAFDHVWKKFRRGERHDSLRDLLPSVAKRMLRRTRPLDLEGDQEFWALENVSFEVKRGEALGIIGPNGAGKSTTLKLLTRILRPTRGSCSVQGRLGALIEVASGFHPDLTGRENVFLQGAIMGMKRAEIADKLDEIIDFAGVSQFIETPVKRYSSGMNARLGFSIAAHLNPDVLIIDEVLSVGDMGFQDRCVARMHEFRRQGVTIVFVSHNLQAIGALCPNALYLKGSVVASGRTDEVITRYISESNQSDSIAAADIVEISCATLERDSERPSEGVHPGDALSLDVTYLAKTDLRELEFGFLVHRSTDGLLVHAQGLTCESLGILELEAGHRVSLRFAFRAHLTRGHYYVECHAFHRPTQHFVGRITPAALFHVHENRVWGGVADLELTCKPIRLHGTDSPLETVGMKV